MARSRGRAGRPWRRARALIIANQSVCGECGHPVDKTLRFPHPKSPAVDHIIPISMGGAELHPGNLQLLHLGCNASKKAGSGRKLRNSQDW